MHQRPLIFCLFFLLYHEKVATVSSDLEPINTCSVLKSWACVISQATMIPLWVIDAARKEIGSELASTIKPPPNDLYLHIAYQTPVHYPTSSIYVAALLTWRLNREFMPQHDVTFWLQIKKGSSSALPLYLRVDVSKPEGGFKKGRLLSYIEFNAHLEKQLSIGESYEITLLYQTLDGSRTFVSILNQTIPNIHLDADDNTKITCDAEQIEKSRKIAARWVSAVSLSLSPIDKLARFTFIAAPKWFCIDRYEVRLVLENAVVVKTLIVYDHELIKNGSNWLGKGVIKDLNSGLNYTIQVRPFDYREDNQVCVCRISSSCNCVMTSTTSFNLPKFVQTAYGKVLEKKFAEEQARQALEAAQEAARLSLLTNIFLVFSIIIALLLIILLLICVFRVLRNSPKWHKPLLLKSSGSGDSLTPLIKDSPVNKVFILNPNSSKTDFVTDIARLLQSKGVTVFYFNFDSKQLEENAFYYVHKAIADADKIILVHCEKTQRLLEAGNLPRRTLSVNQFDNAFTIAFSLLKRNDLKIIHTNFPDYSSPPSHFSETLYTLPRDLTYLFKALRVTINPDIIDNLNTSYADLEQEQQQQVSIDTCSLTMEPDIEPKLESLAETHKVICLEKKTSIPESEEYNNDSGIHSM